MLSRRGVKVLISGDSGEAEHGPARTEPPVLAPASTHSDPETPSSGHRSPRRPRMVHLDYISERKREMQTTLRVLKAYPESKIDLKPSEKSRTAAELVMILAVEERVLQALMQTGSTDPTLLNFEVRSSMAKIISIWQQAVR